MLGITRIRRASWPVRMPQMLQTMRRRSCLTDSRILHRSWMWSVTCLTQKSFGRTTRIWWITTRLIVLLEEGAKRFCPQWKRFMRTTQDQSISRIQCPSISRRFRDLTIRCRRRTSRYPQVSLLIQTAYIQTRTNRCSIKPHSRIRTLTPKWSIC